MNYLGKTGLEHLISKIKRELNRLKETIEDLPVAEPVEEYDGAVTVGPAVDLISFSIDGTSYQAERGMTWREWCSSSYNTKGLTPEDDTESAFLVDSSGNYMLAYNNGNSVSYANDTIEDSGVYIMTDYV